VAGVHDSAVEYEDGVLGLARRLFVYGILVVM
jgi:hypothetical protein